MVLLPHPADSAKCGNLRRTIPRFRHLFLVEPPPPAAVAPPAFARRPERSARSAPPRSRTRPRRATAARAGARASGRRDRPRSRAGTPRHAAPHRRNAGWSRSRWLLDARLPHPRRCRAQGRAALGRLEGWRSETPACLHGRRRQPPGARPSRPAARSISPARSRSRIRLDETPSMSGTVRTSKPSRPSSARSPLRRWPKRKSGPATTTSVPSGRRKASTNASGSSCANSRSKSTTRASTMPASASSSRRRSRVVRSSTSYPKVIRGCGSKVTTIGDSPAATAAASI